VADREGIPRGSWSTNSSCKTLVGHGTGIAP
jgi:hypothetical protein